MTSLKTVAVITVVHPEHEAAMRAFGMTDANRVPGDGGLCFETTYQTRHSDHIRLILSPIGEAGNDASASLAKELKSRFKPKFMFLCGIAAGVRGKNKIGDIVISREIVDTTEKIAKGGKLLPRPDITRPLEGVMKMNAAGQVELADLHSRFKQLFPDPIKPSRRKAKEYKQFVANEPSVHEAAIVSDNVLLRDPSVLAHVAETIHEQARAGEMEAAGFVKVCQGAYPAIPWYVARGISDFGDEFKDDQFHKLASAAVAAYAAAYISDVLDLRIWEPLPDAADAKPRHRWDIQTGDFLIDEALRSLSAYDSANAPDPGLIRKVIRNLVDSRSAVNPCVYHEETAAFLFVICWVRRMVMAYRDELATRPSSPELVGEIINELQQVEKRAAKPFGPEFRLTSWIEDHLGKKVEFVEGLNKLAGHSVMSRTELTVRNKLIPQLHKNLTSAGLAS